MATTKFEENWRYNDQEREMLRQVEQGQNDNESNTPKGIQYIDMTPYEETRRQIEERIKNMPDVTL